MKTKGYIAFFLIMAATGLHGISFAQEGGFSIPDSEEPNAVETTRGENTRNNYSIDHKKPERSTTISTTNTVNKKAVEEEGAFDKPADIKTAPKKETSPQSTSNTDNSPKKKEETEDSVLSFNILYYMIQKFKFSDVIDQ